MWSTFFNGKETLQLIILKIMVQFRLFNLKLYFRVLVKH